MDCVWKGVDILCHCLGVYFFSNFPTTILKIAVIPSFIKFHQNVWKFLSVTMYIPSGMSEMSMSGIALVWVVWIEKGEMECNFSFFTHIIHTHLSEITWNSSPVSPLAISATLMPKRIFLSNAFIDLSSLKVKLWLYPNIFYISLNVSTTFSRILVSWYEAFPCIICNT